MRSLYLFLMILFISACGNTTQPIQPTIPAVQPTVPVDHTVTYRIDSETSRAAFDLTYANETGATVQEQNFTPWVKTFKAKPGQYVYVSAQLTGRIARTVSCVVTIDGEVLQEAESKGQYVIATCKGSVP
jgi:hypothetical protein